MYVESNPKRLARILQDLTFRSVRCPLFRFAFGVKRTCHFALQMSAFDPKLTSGLIRISGRLRAISHSPPVASARGLAVVQTLSGVG